MKTVLPLLGSPILGNILGIISFIIGIVGICITVKTMKSAKRIEADLKKEKIAVLDRQTFRDNLEVYIKKLNGKRNGALNVGQISAKSCMFVISAINDVKGHKSILSESDVAMIFRLEKDMNDLCRLVEKSKEECRKSENINNFDRIIADLINILNKGEYKI